MQSLKIDLRGSERPLCVCLEKASMEPAEKGSGSGNAAEKEKADQAG